MRWRLGYCQGTCWGNLQCFSRRPSCRKGDRLASLCPSLPSALQVSYLLLSSPNSCRTIQDSVQGLSHQISNAGVATERICFTALIPGQTRSTGAQVTLDVTDGLFPLSMRSLFSVYQCSSASRPLQSPAVVVSVSAAN